MTTIYHIIAQTAWEEAQCVGSYHAASLDSEGFIHLSNAEQVLRVANAFYSGQTDLLLLVVDADNVAAELRYEPPAEAPESTERFPHIYETCLENGIDMAAMLFANAEPRPLSLERDRHAGGHSWRR